MYDNWSLMKRLIWLRKINGGGGGSDPRNTFTGAIVRFFSKKSKPIVKIEANFTPIQSLNGQEAPYPPGGGKNKLLVDTVVHEASTAEIVLWEGSLTGTYTLSADASGITTDLPNAGMLKYIVDGTQTIRVSKNNPKETITGTITKVSAVAATSYSRWQGTCKFQMESGSTPTAWTSSSNICPISGHTGCDVWDDPKYGWTINWNQLVINGNFADGTTEWYKRSQDSISTSNNVLTYTAGSKSTYQYINQGSKTIDGGHKVLIVATVKLSQAEKVAFGDGTAILKTFDTMTANVERTLSHIATWTAGRTALYIYPARTAGLDVGETMELKNVMVIDLTKIFGEGNEPTTVEEFTALFPKDYYAYNAGEETCVSAVNGDPYVKVVISFGQTVYGGTLTVNEDGTGSVVAEWAIITANGTESWTKPDNCFKTESLHADSDYPQGISNTYTVGTSYSAVNGNNNRIAAHSTWFRIHDERFSTTDAFKTYLSENNVQFVYELATPITIPLTAQQIQTLVGVNTIWVNDATGDITVQAYGTPVGASSPIVGTGQAGYMII